MPRSKEQNEKIREERRMAIRRCSIPLFARNGFDGTSMQQVAQAAGVSHGTVFLYFPTKEALFEAALLEPLAEAAKEMTTALPAEGTPLDRLQHMVWYHLLMFAREESYVRLVQYVLGLRDRFPALAEQIFAFSAGYVLAVAPVVKAGQELGELSPGDPEEIAGTYFAFLNGCGLVHLAPPEHPVWKSSFRYGMRIFGPLKPLQEV